MIWQQVKSNVCWYDFNACIYFAVLPSGSAEAIQLCVSAQFDTASIHSYLSTISKTSSALLLPVISLHKETFSRFHLAYQLRCVIRLLSNLTGKWFLLILLMSCSFQTSFHKQCTHLGRKFQHQAKRYLEDAWRRMQYQKWLKELHLYYGCIRNLL